jgi:hypothetical protein
MKSTRSNSGGRRRSESGSLMAEMLVALGLLALTLLPLSVSFVREQATARALYHRAVAIAIVDGEIEALAAGGWRAFGPGTHEYTVRADAAKNLPAGRFLLTLTREQVRLEWLPATRGGGGRVVREWRFPATDRGADGPVRGLGAPGEAASLPPADDGVPETARPTEAP